MAYRNGAWKADRDRELVALMRCKTPGHENRQTLGSAQYCRDCMEYFKVLHRWPFSADIVESFKAGERGEHPRHLPSGVSQAIGSQSGSGSSKSTRWPDDWDRLDQTYGPAKSTGKGAPLVARKDCIHDGTKVSLTLHNGKRVYGARGLTIKSPAQVSHVGLIVDCAAAIRIDSSFIRSDSGALRSILLPDERPGAEAKGWPEVLSLRWPDQTAPKVGYSFWKRLHLALPSDTLVCCIGSHGRTGTAMACLLVADGMDPDDAIRTVRKHHCARAIETPGQEAYIRQLLK